MMRFTRIDEPDRFDVDCRQRGRAWLATHATGRPRDYWSPFRPALAEGFHHLCAYFCMRVVPEGTIDHYRSTKNHRELTYEWGNYRYASSTANSNKRFRDAEVLDPFEVQDDWFEIQLPSLQLILTNQVPPDEVARATFTIRQLDLNSRVLIDVRSEYYELYRENQLSLDGLRQLAPLIARAVERETRL